MNESAKKSMTTRAAQTRKKLSDALAALIEEKGYAQVSIQDILARSGISRSAFYLHFEDKEQLLLWGHDHLKALILDDGQGQIGFVEFYRHLEEKHALASSMLTGETAPKMTRFLADILMRNILRLHPPREGNARDTLLAEAAAQALVALMGGWLHRGRPLTAEQMADESQALIARMLARE